MDRRAFLTASAGAVAASACQSVAFAADQPVDDRSNEGRIYKSVKWGMIDPGETIREKFDLCKQLGFDGMELVAPARHDAKEVRAAAEATRHARAWNGRAEALEGQTLVAQIRRVRDEARQDLLTGLADTHAYGGDSILLVPGKVTGSNETHDDVWHRSIEQIRQVLPTASKLGVRVLVENVWNGFCETPEQLRDYIDEIDSPWVGVYFDIGNARKFNPSEDWIRVLGRRIVKLDVKDWGTSNGFCKIGDGDVDWAAVREALDEIDFTGWCTAEVRGGNRDRLAEIAERMTRALAL